MRLQSLAALVLAAAASSAAIGADFGAERPSADARFATESILAGRGQAGLPFAVVDKAAARLYVFDTRGRLLGAAPALLGQQVGDETVPGVGDKPPAEVLPHERTTPAGRFVTEPGRNLEGEAVVWVDYDSGFAIHRVRPGASYTPRVERLRSAAPAEHRVSLGCVVVEGGFFDRIVWPAFGHGAGVVYVLPETRPVASLFAAPALAVAQGNALSTPAR